MPGSVNLHLCVDILIGTSHQAHYRLLIFVCPVTPWIAAWSPCWILISPTAEPAVSHLRDDKFLCQMVGLGSPIETPV